MRHENNSCLIATTEEKRRFFDRIAAQWDSFGGPPDAAEKQREFVRIATEHQPARILDAGCGTGVLVPHFRELCPQAAVVEQDLSPEMLAVNRSKHGDGPGITYCCGELETVALPLESFESIVFFNVLPHFASLEEAIRRARNLLGIAGRMAVGHLMDSSELNAFHASMEAPVCHDVLPRVEALVTLFREAGLSVLRAEERPGWYLVLVEKLETADCCRGGEGEGSVELVTCGRSGRAVKAGDGAQPRPHTRLNDLTDSH
jgi:ubiquinone/menaquinone biosynthesis C-methylase UbiE